MTPEAPPTPGVHRATPAGDGVQAVSEDYRWPHQHLLGLGQLSAEDIRFLLATARGFEEVSTRSVKKVPALRGRVVVSLFFEDSTRTRASFHLAASRLSADVLDFAAKGSSVSKGETLRDTARNIEAMGVDAIVCRHPLSGAAHLLARSVRCSVLNAGDGQHEHPTQGLLDAYTIAKRLGRMEDSSHEGRRRGAFDLSGLTVAIVGDIAHSRVARSNVHGLRKLGAHVVLVGPPTLLPGGFADLGCELSHDLDAVLPRADVVNMLRVQFERLSGPAFPSVREYAALYGLTHRRLARAKPGVLVMHPGPMNRGIEIESAVADGSHSAILAQVTHGLAVRMAALYLVTGVGGGVNEANEDAAPKSRSTLARERGPRGMLLVISGPSGVGKTTITHQVERALGGVFSVSMTTRPRGAGDREGVDYSFVTAEEFRRHRDAGELLEWAEVFGNFYGTPRRPVAEALAAGRLVILEIDVQGAIQIKRQMPEAYGVFVLPPSEGELLERLRRRKREDETVIQRRFAQAKEEIALANRCGIYDAFVVNDDLERAVRDAVTLVRGEWERRAQDPRYGSIH